MRLRASGLPAHLREMLDMALFDVSDVAPDGSIDKNARWEHAVAVVDIRAPITDGLSGALVFDALLTRPGQRAERVIVKVADVDDIAEEWTSIRSLRMAGPAHLTMPVLAVYTFIDQPSDGARDFKAAIVYDHVANAYRHRTEPVRSLRDLAADPGVDAASVVQVVEVVTRALHSRLWGDRHRGMATVETFNLDLGPDLGLDLGSPGQSGPDDGTATPGRPPTSVTYRAMLSSSTSPVPGDGRIAIGDVVRLRDVRRHGAGHPPVYRLRSASVATTGADDPVAGVEGEESEATTVVGRVVALRSLDWWDRIRRHVPSAVLEPDSVKFDAVRVGEPFAHLEQHLTEERSGRTTGPTHGDLNPGNVLVVGDFVYAIDFARAGERPPVSDPAWLEMCLLRDVFAAVLGAKRLVRLQRLLGLATRVVDAMPETWRPTDQLGTGDAALDRAFAILWSVRCSARDWHRGRDHRPGWWYEYLVHVRLAGFRSLKFDDATQSSEAITAVLAATGVAAEWLGRTPYRFWVETELRQAALPLLEHLRATAPEHPAIQADIATVLGDVIAAVDRADSWDDQLRTALAGCRDRCMPAWYRAQAQEMVGSEYLDTRTHQTGSNGRLYIDLRAIQGRPADTPDDLDVRGARYDRPATDDPVDDPTLGSRRTPDLLAATSAVWLATRRIRDGVLILRGEAGSGKSTVAREIRTRYAAAILGRAADGRHPNGPPPELPPLLPVTLAAATILRELAGGRPPAEVARALLTGAAGSQVEAALRLGGLHLTIDGFDDISIEDHADLAAWIRALHSDYPRVRMVLCHRGGGSAHEDLPFPSLLLQAVSSLEARQYVVARLSARGRPDSEFKADALVRALADDAVSDAVRELARSPMFLSYLVDWLAERDTLPRRPGDLVSGLTREFLTDHIREAGGITVTYDECAAALAALADRVGADDELDLDVAWSCLGGRNPATDQVLDVLIRSRIVHRAGGSLRFSGRAFQRYFAAVALDGRQRDVAYLTTKVLSHRERGAVEDLVRYGEHSRDVVHDLIGPTLRADPVLAARLLRSTDGPDPDDVDRFIDEQVRSLFAASGDHRWRAAVDALFTLGTDRAWHALHDVVRSPDASTLARSAALAGLLRLLGAAGFGTRPAVYTRTTVETIRRLLAGSAPVELRVQAINAVVDCRLDPLVAYLADLVDPAEPWPIIRAARRGLISLDQLLTRRQTAVYEAACAARLPAAEAERLRAVEVAVVEVLWDERWELIDTLSRAGRLELVLPLRFAFDPSEPYYWSDRRRLGGGTRDQAAPRARRAFDVLNGNHTAAKLVATFARGEDLLAVAAAHRLLTDGAAEAARLVDHVSATSSPQKLLAVAATMSQLDSDGLRAVRAIISGLILSIDLDRLEALGALLYGLPAHKRSTKRLILSALTAVRDLDPPALCGPLERVFHQAQRWSDEEVTAALLAGPAERDLMVRGLSLALYTNDAGAPDLRRLPPDAVEALRAYWPPTSHQRLDLVRASTACGLTSALDDALTAAADTQTTAVWTLATHPRYGPSMVNGLGDILTCVGHLGFLAGEAGQVGEAERARRFLTRFDCAGLDPSVAQGRLLGLAILGDWRPLLQHLESGDPAMHRAVRNAVDIWRPRRAPPGLGDATLAQVLADRLADPDLDLAPDVRSTLAEVKAVVERRLGRIVLSGP